MRPGGTANGLPSGWEFATIAELFEQRLGKMLDVSKNVGQLRPYLRNASVRWFGFDLDDVKEMRVEQRELKEVSVRAGDPVVCEGGEPGRAAVWRSPNETFVIQKACHRLRPKAGVDPSFYAYWFAAEAGSGRLARAFTGSTIKHLTGVSLRGLRTPLPPTGEQRRIIAEIEKQFTRLDGAVATLEAVQAKLKRARASVLKAAVEGRLVPTEAELARAEGRSYEPASVLLERILEERRRDPKGKKYQQLADSSSAELPVLPEGWARTTLDAIADIVGGIAKNKKDTDGREVPYLRVANVQRGRLDLSVIKTIVAPEATIADLRLIPGDILLNEGGDRDKLGRGWVWEGQIAECIHQNHVFRARVYGNGIQPKYISHYANSLGQSYFVDEGKQTTNLASISLGKIKRLPVAIPPAAEQTRIVAEVERRLSVLDALDHSVEQNLARCNGLRQSILKRAFEGKLVPQDPADEPASELLARIRMQRSAEAIA